MRTMAGSPAIVPALAVALAIAVVTSGCIVGPVAEHGVRIGTTTSVRDSGLLDVLIDGFRADTGTRAVAIVAGTGQVMEIARRGDVDVLLTHSPAREARFLDDGFGLSRDVVMTNRFLVAGPPGTGPWDSAAAAFRAIADGQVPFASRGDGSGTHDKEQDIWMKAGYDPATFSTAWYKETGNGQSATLLFAAERGAFALTDEASWARLRAAGELGALAVAVADDPLLINTYSVIPVADARNPGGATAFREWILGAGGQRVIDGFRVDGVAVFHASRQEAAS